MESPTPSSAPPAVADPSTRTDRGAGFDVAAIRAHFPALARQQDGRPVVFLDGPGGSQVPGAVVEAVSRYLSDTNANAGGAFVTSQESDLIVAQAHAAAADLLGAASPDEVKFGPNMTTLTLGLSRAIGATLRPGDEIVITRLDHEADRGPWQLAARDAGAVIREVDFDPQTCTLRLDGPDGLGGLLGPRTRLVAVGYASNAVGTINPVAEIVRRAHAVGALAFVDAVHYAPHGLIDVQALGADFLACSAYKFFGPHVGLLWGRLELLHSLPAYKVRPAHDRWETGTPNHEGLAGTSAAVDYLAELGRSLGAGGLARRPAIERAMASVVDWEAGLSARFLEGVSGIAGLRLWGSVDPARSRERTPTFALRLEGWAPRALAEELGRRGIFVWDGDFYATALIERLGLAERGGVVRAGFAHYTTSEEVDRLLDELRDLAAQAPGSGGAASGR
ncbi:MAG TPA: cysteine desulfurase-like protein [Candidatus Limnocylindrales bacterium]|nr:cysteine desulfurase-like protein [Candidatus Limnocylindrales bacterium]